MATTRNPDASVKVLNWEDLLDFPAPSGAASRVLLDYDVRPDTQPLYIGKGPANAAEGDPVWRITKFEYEGPVADARLLQFDTREDVAWTARAAPTPAWGF